MTADLLLLLPPSEGKAEGGRGRFGAGSGEFGRRLATPRRAVLEALAGTALDERVLGVRGRLHDRALAATQALVTGHARPLPAWRRFTGVVWEHLDPATIEDEQRAAIVVPSGLLGLVSGNDPVPDHRLKFSVTLSAIGRLDRFWRPHLTAVLRRHRPGATIIDLLPLEHGGAVDLEAVASARAVVRTTFTGSTGHDAKAVKGMLARHLLHHGIGAADDFRWNGWCSAYDPAARRITVRR